MRTSSVTRILKGSLHRMSSSSQNRGIVMKTEADSLKITWFNSLGGELDLDLGCALDKSGTGRVL